MQQETAGKRRIGRFGGEKRRYVVKFEGYSDEAKDNMAGVRLAGSFFCPLSKLRGHGSFELSKCTVIDVGYI